jgi:hypothetical protein
VVEAPIDAAGKIYSPWSISGRQIPGDATLYLAGSVAQRLIRCSAGACEQDQRPGAKWTVDFFRAPRPRQRMRPWAAPQEGSGPDTHSIPCAGLSVGRGNCSAGASSVVSLIPLLNFPSHARPEAGSLRPALYYHPGDEFSCWTMAARSAPSFVSDCGPAGFRCAIGRVGDSRHDASASNYALAVDLGATGFPQRVSRVRPARPRRSAL